MCAPFRRIDVFRSRTARHRHEGAQRPNPAKMSSVSVIIPSYNYARFLPGCVQSVLTQEDVEVEVLVIDDCSSDETHIVGEELADSPEELSCRVYGPSTGQWWPTARFSSGAPRPGPATGKVEDKEMWDNGPTQNIANFYRDISKGRSDNSDGRPRPSTAA